MTAVLHESSISPSIKKLIDGSDDKENDINGNAEVSNGGMFAKSVVVFRNVVDSK
jgi:hypothetical protein